mmetsp:Transcript_2403/g.7843  ORF Transcript_2403/g.7843 Transcript_2403/m.7843 type:complete len:202 (-) Transcript_2403:772-1377(-)
MVSSDSTLSVTRYSSTYMGRASSTQQLLPSMSALASSRPHKLSASSTGTDSSAAAAVLCRFRAPPPPPPPLLPLLLAAAPAEGGSRGTPRGKAASQSASASGRRTSTSSSGVGASKRRRVPCAARRCGKALEKRSMSSPPSSTPSSPAYSTNHRWYSLPDGLCRCSARSTSGPSPSAVLRTLIVAILLLMLAGRNLDTTST